MNVKYEVKAPLFIKVVVALGVALYIVMIFGGTSLIVDLWMANNWIGVVAVLLSACIFPVFTLIVFFTKTVFTDKGLIHTNFALRKVQKTYEEIDTVVITNRSDIRLHFVDGTSIKVLTGQNHLSKTLQVLEKYVDLRLRKSHEA